MSRVQDNDPCWKERQLHYKCLQDNDGNKDKCEAFNLNGKVCKEFWHKVRVERKQNNIRPFIPPPEEREKLKKEYFEKHKKLNVRLHKEAHSP